MNTKNKDRLVAGLIVGAALMVTALLWLAVGRENTQAILRYVLIAGVMVFFLALRYRWPAWLHRNLRSSFRLDD